MSRLLHSPLQSRSLVSRTAAATPRFWGRSVFLAAIFVVRLDCFVGRSILLFLMVYPFIVSHMLVIVGGAVIAWRSVAGRSVIGRRVVGSRIVARRWIVAGRVIVRRIVVWRIVVLRIVVWTVIVWRRLVKRTNSISARRVALLCVLTS